MADNLLLKLNPADVPTLEQERSTPEEEQLLDHWIATMPSAARQARKHGRESLKDPLILPYESTEEVQPGEVLGGLK